MNFQGISLIFLSLFCSSFGQEKPLIIGECDERKSADFGTEYDGCLQLVQLNFLISVNDDNLFETSCDFIRKKVSIIMPAPYAQW